MISCICVFFIDCFPWLICTQLQKIGDGDSDFPVEDSTKLMLVKELLSGSAVDGVGLVLAHRSAARRSIASICSQLRLACVLIEDGDETEAVAAAMQAINSRMYFRYPCFYYY